MRRSFAILFMVLAAGRALLTQRSRHTKTGPLPVWLALTLAQLAVSALPLAATGQVLVDNFDDNTKAPFWFIFEVGSGPTVAETNASLEFTIPADSVAGLHPIFPQLGPYFEALYGLSCQIAGDFDVYVDYSLLSWPPENGGFLALQAFVPPPGPQLELARTSGFFIAGERYESQAAVLGSPYVSVPTTHRSGKLRLTRAGSLGASYYSEDGTWVPVTSGPVSTAAVQINLHLVSRPEFFARELVQAALDNFVVNQGELICSCGNSVVEPTEQCDDGNTISGDGCDSKCQLECGTVTKPKLTMAKLNTPPGDDKLTFTGQLTLPSPLSPPLNPLANGVRLLINDNAASVLDLTIPGGAFVNPPGKGWKVNGSGTSWTYQDKTKTPTGGIYKMVIQDKSKVTPGLLKFTANGKAGSYAVASAELPVTARIIIAPSGAQCGDANFPSCGFNASGSTLKCK